MQLLIHPQNVPKLIWLGERPTRSVLCRGEAGSQEIDRMELWWERNGERDLLQCLLHQHFRNAICLHHPFWFTAQKKDK